MSIEARKNNKRDVALILKINQLSHLTFKKLGFKYTA